MDICKFGYCYVVFDGYGNGPFTEDMQHIKRSGKVSPNITFTSDTKCVKSQEEFLDNQNNKVHFIPVCCRCWYNNSQSCFRVHSSGKHVVVSTGNTDVLCLLIHHWKKAASRLYFRTMKSNTDNCHNFWERTPHKTHGYQKYFLKSTSPKRGPLRFCQLINVNYIILRFLNNWEHFS